MSGRILEITWFNGFGFREIQTAKVLYRICDEIGVAYLVSLIANLVAANIAPHAACRKKSFMHSLHGGQSSKKSASGGARSRNNFG
jgi:hypothetical protein